VPDEPVAQLDVELTGTCSTSSDASVHYKVYGSNYAPVEGDTTCLALSPSGTHPIVGLPAETPEVGPLAPGTSFPLTVETTVGTTTQTWSVLATLGQDPF
jgi:hypothetical protein